jgi:hypothetical protein
MSLGLGLGLGIRLGSVFFLLNLLKLRELVFLLTLVVGRLGVSKEIISALSSVI